jgi:hypothetical protein
LAHCGWRIAGWRIAGWRIADYRIAGWRIPGLPLEQPGFPPDSRLITYSSGTHHIAPA